jgi:CheY-like chemotaxis protein
MSLFKIKEVYLVDDDAIVRMVAGKILRSIEFKNPISGFENGQIALDEISRKIATNEFEFTDEKILLLLDINMPIMDSWAFLDEFKKINQEIKKHFLISIITSSIDTGDKLKAFSYADVSDYITKPLTGKHILDFLTKHSLYEEE